MPAIYVPILKGKEGEYGALKELSDDTKDLVLPLVEIPSIPFDWENEEPSKTLEEHVGNVAQRIQAAWSHRDIFLDFPATTFLGTPELDEALRVVLTSCQDTGLSIIPVVSLKSSTAFRVSAADHHRACRRGLALRLQLDDFDDERDLDDEVADLVADIQIEKQQMDLIIDLGTLVGSAIPQTLLVVRSLRGYLADLDDWRRVILAASSFPQDLSDVDARSQHLIPRVEWELWQRLQRRPDRSLRKDLIFADYAIAHPEPKEMDPRMMRMSASIRYTTDDAWLIVKGRNVRQWGYEQFYDLSVQVIESGYYKGPTFSSGDQFIHACAGHQAGPGNATTWRRVATNHHITLVAKALASSAEP